jgi:hypothetical protein
MSEFLMPPVVPDGVCAQQPLHAGDQVGLGGFQHEVQMVGHEAKGMHLPIGLLACFPKLAAETLSILVVLEDSLPAITAIDDVIHRAGVLDGQLARHSGRLLRRIAGSTQE